MSFFYWGEQDRPKSKGKPGADSMEGEDLYLWIMAVHEAGHYVVGKKLGGWGARSYLKKSRRAWTEITMPAQRSDAIMFAAGNEAQRMEFGTRYKLSWIDLGEAKASCRRANKKGDDITVDGAVSIAAQMCRKHRSEILRVAQKIHRTGHS